MTSDRKIYLASTSPRRKELLAQVGMSFQPCVIEIDESVWPDEAPDTYVARLARAKAAAALAQLADMPDRAPDAIVIAADTTVTIDGHILGKPADQADAFAMWQRLSGRTHQVMTGVAVATDSQIWVQVVVTEVVFSSLSVAQMQAYWACGEPQGKAGGYAIQGRGAAFIPRISGSYSNVVGLPLVETLDLLRQAGYTITD